MAIHGYCGSTHNSAWNIDAYNMCGIYTTADVDNGVLVTLNGMNIDATSKKVKGYEYNVALASASSTGVWVIETPEVGTTLEEQYLSDPRLFTNVKGRPMSIKYVHPQTDCFEFNAEAFASGNLPITSEIGYYVPITTNGKLGAPVQNAPASGAYFRVEALKDISVGQAYFTVAILRCMAN